MKKVVGLGANVLDTLIQCNNYPLEDKKTPADAIVRIGGGPVSNALVVISRLGVQAEVIGAFADDSEGKQILSELNSFGVSTDHVSILKDKTSFVSYVIISKEAQTRTCVFNRGSVPDIPEDIDYSPIEDASLLHLDGNYLKSAICAAKYAKTKGVKVSLDGGGVYSGIEELLPLVDILVTSAEFSMEITNCNDAKKATELMYEKYTPEVLVVTDGVNGGYYYQEGKVCHYESNKVDAVDTNGAGDTFHGAFIAGYLQQMSVGEACKFASAVAAYKCQFIGARKYPLDRDVAKNLLKNL